MYRARRRWSAAVGTVAVASLVTATQRRGGPAAHDTHTLEFLIMHLRSCLAGGLGAALLLPLAGIASAAPTTGQFQFEPLPASSPCTPGGNPAQQIVLPPGFVQTEIAREGQGGTRDLWDMNTVNETGPDAGRFLYRTHEISPNAQVSVTDLQTGETRVLAKRADWERFDGIAWTPWGTIIAAEEVSPAAVKDPAVPQAVGGLVYEIDPVTGAAVARPAVGSRSHEGLRFDALGNLYGISERNPGYIYRFTPDRRGDLASGQLYALKVTNDDGDNDPLTGSATWVPLDRAAVQVDSDAAAAAAGATGYNRPEDIETADSTGNSRGGQALFVAVTGDDSVYKVDLRQPAGGQGAPNRSRLGVCPRRGQRPSRLRLTRQSCSGPQREPLHHRGSRRLCASQDARRRHLGSGAQPGRGANSRRYGAIRQHHRLQRRAHRHLLQQGRQHPLRQHSAPRG
jgi:hypothetical protein